MAARVSGSSRLSASDATTPSPTSFNVFVKVSLICTETSVAASPVIFGDSAFVFSFV